MELTLIYSVITAFWKSNAVKQNSILTYMYSLTSYLPVQVNHSVSDILTDCCSTNESHSILTNY